MYTYIRSEPGLYTVGHTAPDGAWHSDSDHTDREAAAARCAYLNGGPAPAADPPAEPEPGSLAHIVAEIDAFDDECRRAVHTDTQGAWYLLHFIRERLAGPRIEVTELRLPE